ncbi:MAG TPA: ABC transporter ATP-binding protein [Opitutaceae bacterium]|nr:ABC transporter ATP-binding protein [Opitutaceae bacterium]
MSADIHMEDEFKPKLDLGLWRKIFRHALAHPRILAWLASSCILIAMADASFALLTKWVIDDATLHGGAHLVQYAIAYTIVATVLSVGVWTFITMAGTLSNNMGHDIRKACFARLQELEFAFFDTRPVGWLISRLTSDCDRLSRVIAWGAVDLLWSSSLVVMISCALLWLNFKLGLLVLCVLPPLAVLSAYFQRKLILSARDIRKFNSQITAAYNESITGVRTTKTLVRERENLGEFEGLSGKMFASSVRNAVQSAVYIPLVLTLGSVAAGLALWRGGEGYLAEIITLGTLVAFISYAGQFFNPINQMASVLTQMQSAQAAGERVMGLLATVPQIKDSPEVLARIEAARATGPQPGVAIDGMPSRIGTIEFRNVTFAYGDGPPVLEDFNLTIPAGATIALVGPSGGGKTTIVGLLCRFYEPTKGEILIDGIDYRKRSLQWLQSNLGIVLQTPHLFKGTIGENIRYGRLAASDDDVARAAKLVNADGFIRAMEKGYSTEAGEGGNRLSTGQKQLVSFARALLSDPQVFVMDEATSSIDTETEHLIQDGLAQVMAGRISVVIAHRLSTIRRASRILVINKGKIEESGDHASLIRARGHYFALYTNQFQREREEAVIEGSAAAV